uniref:Inhibitor I9 domain-containing protein n=1 Tax=Oryza rufipogon TaxID=4529 RepID=A0A0E0N774_ORYRU
MAARVFALFLGTTTILVVSTAPHAHSYPAAAALHHQCIGAPAIGGENPLEYKKYIVLLRPWPDAATAGMDDDDGARRSWCLSFLPGNITAGGKPRLVRSYKHVVNGFAALLTEAEMDAVSKKPGFWRCFQNGIARLCLQAP